MKIGEHTVSNYDVLVATPGKLIHYLEKFNLQRLQYLVIDEADQMEGDWLKELESKVPSNCQKLLFSATLASDPQFLAALKVCSIPFLQKIKIYFQLKHPILYSTGTKNAPSGLVEQRVQVELRLKPYLARVLIKPFKRVLIFANSTETAEKLHTLLKRLGVKGELLSSSLDHDWKR